MSGLTSEHTGFTGIIGDPHHAIDALRVLFRRMFLPQVESLQKEEGTVNYVRYLMVPEPVKEREFLFNDKRILLYVGDEEGEVMFDFERNPKVPYVLSHDVSAGQDIMIINVPLMARTVCVPDGEPFDINELEFTGPDYMWSTIEAFVRGDIRFTYPSNISMKT